MINISEKIGNYEQDRDFINAETLKFLRLTLADVDEIIEVFKRKRLRLEELKISIKKLEGEVNILNKERTDLLIFQSQTKEKLEKHHQRMEEDEESSQSIQSALAKRNKMLDKRDTILDEREEKIDEKIKGYKIAKSKHG